MPLHNDLFDNIPQEVKVAGGAALGLWVAYEELFADVFKLGGIVKDAKANFDDPKIQVQLKKMKKDSILKVNKAVTKHRLKFGNVATSSAIVKISSKKVVPLVLEQTKQYPQYANKLWTRDNHIDSTKKMLNAHKLPINTAEIKQAASKVGNDLKPKQLRIQQQEFAKKSLEIKKTKKVIASNEKAIKTLGKKSGPLKQKVKIQNNNLKKIVKSIEKNNKPLGTGVLGNLNRPFIKTAGDSFTKTTGKILLRGVVVGALALVSIPIIIIAVSIGIEIGLDLIEQHGGLLKSAEKISNNISKLAQFAVTKLPNFEILTSGTLFAKIKGDHAYTSRTLNKNAPPKYNYVYS